MLFCIEAFGRSFSQTRNGKGPITRPLRRVPLRRVPLRKLNETIPGLQAAIYS